MTNAEKFKTVEERTAAFNVFCNKQARECEQCRLMSVSGTSSCRFVWLEMETEMSATEVSDMLEIFSRWRGIACMEPCPYTESELSEMFTNAVALLRKMEE